MAENKTSGVNLFLIGGFLGSGKTTAIVNACRQLIEQKRRVAVITNDQGDQQVDTEYLKSLNVPNAEVGNGCFCCNYGDLEKNIIQFNETLCPDTIFAESVGSCTDLVATIAKPFVLFHPEFRVVISVFADAFLLYSIIKGTSSFIEESVRYIYKKQLEEADILILNKTDLLSKDELEELKEVIGISYAFKKTLYQDSYNVNDIANWLDTLGGYTVPASRQSLELNYDTYGAGEAALAWLDKRITIHTTNPIAADIATQLAAHIYQGLKAAGYTIGHLKFLLNDDEWFRKISYTTSGKVNNAVQNHHPAKHISVLINARVQTTPQLLNDLIAGILHETIMTTGCRIITEKENSFQPGYPKPVYRMADE